MALVKLQIVLLMSVLAVDLISTASSTTSTTPSSKPISQQLLSGSCNFDRDLCGYTSTSGHTWLQISSSDDNHGLKASTDGHYAYFKTNTLGILNGNKTSLTSPELNIDGCIDITFLYSLPHTKTQTLSVQLIHNGQTTVVKDITGSNMNTWKLSEIKNVCVTKSTKLVFETSKLSYYAYVGIDNIKITKPTAPTTKAAPTILPSTSSSVTSMMPSTMTQSTRSQEFSTVITREPTSPSSVKSGCDLLEKIKFNGHTSDFERLQLEKQKLYLENQKLELEKQKLHLENHQLTLDNQKRELEKQKLNLEIAKLKSAK